MTGTLHGIRQAFYIGRLPGDAGVNSSEVRSGCMYTTAEEMNVNRLNTGLL